jgi:uncharacterized protein
MQFIPCINDFGTDDRKLTAERYGQFLCTLFDLWHRDRMSGKPVSVRHFDNLLNIYAGHPPELCAMQGVCNVQFIIESDGGAYPCDFYVLDKWLLGNVCTDSFADMLLTEAAERFTAESRHVREECRECRRYPLCRGGCKRDKEPVQDGIPSQNRFCKSYKTFFDYSRERFIKMRNPSPFR